MTREQEEKTDREAKCVAECDARDELKRGASWWVCYRSHNLGIVDASGMVDVAGEIARRFTARYNANARRLGL